MGISEIFSEIPVLLALLLRAFDLVVMRIFLRACPKEALRVADFVSEHEKIVHGASKKAIYVQSTPP